jgi:ribosomal protein S12 methylthiotransferase
MGGANHTSGTTIGLIHLGCEKNLVDSERILGTLAVEGHAVCQDPNDAEVIVVNTCGFIGPAKQESIDTILAAVERKNAGEAKAVIVAGCLGQRYADELQSDIPEIDAIIPLGDLERLKEVADAVSGDAAVPKAPLPSGMSLYPVGNEGARLRLTPRHYVCAIPLMRGKNRSKTLEDLVAEATELTADGARELILIAQDTGSYGLDLYQKQSLHELLRALDAGVPDLWGMRLMYLHPMMAQDDLFSCYGELERLLPYVDMPIQHGSDELLRLMKRGTTRERIRDRAARFRERDPRMVLRTTVLLGFPGETEQHVDELCELLEEVQFDRLGTFTYSREENTPGYDMPGQVDDAVMEARMDRVMTLQAGIAEARGAARVGEECDAWVEEIAADGTALGRTYGEAPEVDGAVLIDAPEGAQLVTGGKYQIRITEAQGYDLLAELAGGAEG